MKRWISLFLAAMLVFTAAIGGFAESVAVDAEDPEIEMVAVEDEAVDEGTNDLPLSDAVESEILPSDDDFILEVEPETTDLSDALLVAPDEEPDDDAETVAEVESEGIQADAPGDVWRYARVVFDGAFVYEKASDSSALAALSEGDVLLWLEACGDMAQVAFDTQWGVREGYMSADSLEFMGDGDTDAFLDALVVQGSVTAYQNDINFLLPRLDCVLEGEETVNQECAPADSGEMEAGLTGDNPGTEPSQPADPGTSGDNPGTEPSQPADPGTSGDGDNPDMEPSQPADPAEADEAGEPEAGAPAPDESDAPTATVQAAPQPKAAASNAAVAPTKVILSATGLSMGLGESYSGLRATLEPANASTTLSWKSSSSSVVLVDKNTGKLKGLRTGSATITVKTANKKYASCKVTVKAAPRKVSVSPKSVTLLVGDTLQLKKPSVNSGAASAGFSYKSSNKAVAKVSSAGKITAVKRGSATITVKTYNGRSAAVKVTVNTPPATVAFTRTSVDFYPGQTQKLTAKAYDADGLVTPAKLYFSLAADQPLEDMSCIDSVDADSGEVTAYQEGRTRVTVCTDGGIRAAVDCTVNVLPEAEGIELNQTAIRIGVKETYKRLSYTIQEGTAASVTWRSANAKIARVDPATGAVTGIAKGTTTIFAKPHRGTEVGCSVTVLAAPSAVTLTPARMDVTDLAPVQISAGVNTVSNAFTYAYADTASRDIAALNANTGEVTPIRSGTAKIKVAAYNGVSAIFTLRIDLPVNSVEVSNAGALSGIAEYQSMAVKAVPRDAYGGIPNAELSYAIAEGDNCAAVVNGVLTGVNEGPATLRVSAGDCHADVPIAVRKGPKSIALKPARTIVGVGETLKLNPVLTDKRGDVIQDALSVFTTSAGKKIVSCYSSSVSIKARAVGKAVVTVKHANGRVAKVKITVRKKPWAVKLSASSVKLGVGQAKTLRAILPSGTASTCTFRSSNSAVASVNATTGKVTAVAVGKAVITVTTHNKKKAAAKVTVSRAPDYVVLTGKGLKTLTTSNGNGTYSTSYRLALSKGKTAQLSARVEYPARGSIKSYVTSDPSVATVSKTGLITALKPGTADITVTATGGAAAMVRVSVWGKGAAPDKRLAFSQAEITVPVGKTVAVPILTGSGIGGAELVNVLHWSGDDGIAAVTVDGSSKAWNITGVSVGDTTVTAEASGCTAVLAVSVVPSTDVPLPADDGIHFESTEISMTEGEEPLTPRVVDEEGQPVDAALTSDNPEIVIAAEGKLTPVSPGTVTVTASFGDFRAYAHATVQPSTTTVGLTETSLSMFIGDRIALHAASNSSQLSFASDDENVVRISSKGVVTAIGAGITNVWAIAGSARASCMVSVQKQITGIAITPASSDGCRIGASLTLTASAGAADEKGTVSFTVNPPDVAQITSSDSGLTNGEAKCVLKLNQAGTALVTVTTGNGLSATAQITVADNNTPRYRLFTACGYAMPGYTSSGKLVFSLHNTNLVRRIFGKSGLGYAVNTNLVNPTRSKLLSALGSYMSGATENDVTVVYLCSHGHYGKPDAGSAKTYYMSFPVLTATGVNYQKITSIELFNKLKKGKGRVILILDSCYSGIFIKERRADLDANGRISVITAATDTRASYYNTPDTRAAMDFFTFFLLMGTGYDGINGWYIKDTKRGKGVAPGYMLADSYENHLNKDGVITLAELYGFASKSIAANISAYSRKSWYWGDPRGTQRSYSYLAGDAGDIALYKPKS